LKIIGITGGVGAGKSTVLSMIGELCDCHILLADEAAHEVKKKGQVCYEELIGLLGRDILKENDEIDKGRMAEIIFAPGNEGLLKKVNDIIHPRVKEFILKTIEEYMSSGKVSYFFIEAALLIEEGYRDICDELWYVYADEQVRKKRLRQARGYSDEKIRSIMDKQNDDMTFRKFCDHVIENNGDIEVTRRQLLSLLKNDGRGIDGRG
jgi:dephospho-CoA kinase